MITTITLNPAIDRTFTVDECIMGQVHRIKYSREDVGGKGINVANVIHLLEGDVTAIGFLGDKNNHVFKEYFLKKDMVCDFININDKNRVNTKIVDLKLLTTTEFNEKGFRINRGHKDLIKKKIQQYASVSQYMIISGSVPSGCSRYFYRELIELIKDDTKVVLDADGELLREGVKASPFMIKPNIHELECTFGVKVDSIDAIIHAARTLSNTYNIQWVLVSMGKKGSVLVSKERVIIANPIQVKTLSSVGAGDSMLGGFVYSYSLDENPINALMNGTACGTLAVTTEGTQGFTRDQIKAIQAEVVVNDVSRQYAHYYD